MGGERLGGRAVRSGARYAAKRNRPGGAGGLRLRRGHRLLQPGRDVAAGEAPVADRSPALHHRHPVRSQGHHHLRRRGRRPAGGHRPDFRRLLRTAPERPLGAGRLARGNLRRSPQPGQRLGRPLLHHRPESDGPRTEPDGELPRERLALGGSRRRGQLRHLGLRLSSSRASGTSSIRTPCAEASSRRSRSRRFPVSSTGSTSSRRPSEIRSWSASTRRSLPRARSSRGSRSFSSPAPRARWR